MDAEDAGSPQEDLEPRPPTEEDLVKLCQALNAEGAKYVVVGGFAMIQLGFPRSTIDVDLVIATDSVNEARVFKALESLPDQAVKELQPGETSKYKVIRVADEIVVGLMKSACGIEYEEASRETIVRVIRGVAIPFASPTLLWRMKKPTHRAKDAPDLVFLEYLFASEGQKPPGSV